MSWMKRKDGVDFELVPHPLMAFEHADSEDLSLRLWVFEMIHGNEYVNLTPQTLDYCEQSYRWLRNGRHEATGEKVIRGPWAQPAPAPPRVPLRSSIPDFLR